MRSVVYARFSTDKQSESSITDQTAICRAVVVREGWAVVAEYRDEGVSGSTPVAKRSGGAHLLADALAGRFDVLILEGLDRLSRDSVEQERVVRRLEHLGIRIVGVSDGYDSTSSARKLHRGMRGIINEVYLDDLRAKTHRGLAGQVDRGLFAGGMSYGYRSVEADGGHRLEIVAEQAETVRWIFGQYAGSLSSRQIAHELNRQKVPSPRGSTWAVSAVYGSPAKGTGILNNVLYTGQYVWNRSQWVKDPDTGIRKRIERPRSEWKVAERPELRIIPDALWKVVRQRMGEHSARGSGRRPSTLFGGILRCGICGGAVVAIDAYRYGCAAAKDRGTCAGLHVPRKQADMRLLSAIRDDLLSPDAIAAIQAKVRRILEQRTAAGSRDAKAARVRLAELDREITNLTDAVASCGFSKALSDRLAKAEAERDALATVKPIPDARIPNVLNRYRELLSDLRGSLLKSPQEARQAIAKVMPAIVLEQRGPEVWAQIESDAGLLLAAAGGTQIEGVAGARVVHWNHIRIK